MKAGHFSAKIPGQFSAAINTLRKESPAHDERAIVSMLGEFDQLWTALYPAEQTRIVHLLVERVTVGENGIAVDLRHDGVAALTREMMAPQKQRQAA